MLEIQQLNITGSALIPVLSNGYLPTEITFSKSAESPVPMRCKLTGHIVRRKAPKVEQFLWDSELPGFGLRCSPTGHKSWIIRFRERGTKRLLTLGDARKVSVHIARIEARRRLADNVLDGLPVRPAPAPQQGLTVAEFIDEFLLAQNRHWKPSTLKRNMSLIKCIILPNFGPMAVAEVARADIIRWRDSCASKPSTFNRALPCLSVMFKLAEKLGYRPKGSNPCKNSTRYKVKLTERFLSPAEYRALGAVLKDAEEEMPVSVAIIRLLIYTGARVGEICGLEWQWIKPPRIFLPDSKTGPKTLYLNAPARALLEALETSRPTGPVFSYIKCKAKPNQVAADWQRLRNRAGLHDLRLHDLRHSFASLAIRDGIPLTVIGKLLGHALPETTARYAHLADDAVSDAARRVCGSIAAKLGMSS